VGRRSYIYHDGSDHVAPKVEEIPWRTSSIEEVATDYGPRRTSAHSMTRGTETWLADQPEPDRDPAVDLLSWDDAGAEEWNDCDSDY
jgi:hypothetical protein